MDKSFAEQEVEALSKAWEHHLSGFFSPVAFISRQRPLYYSRDYKSGLFVAAECNDVSLWPSSADYGVMECFIVGC